MRAATLTCTASAYRACYSPSWQSLTWNQTVFCLARQTRAGLTGRSAIDLALTPSTVFEFRKHSGMNFAT